MYSKAEFWNYWDLLYIADQKITDISSYFSIDSSDARCILLSLWYSILQRIDQPISKYRSTKRESKLLYYYFVCGQDTTGWRSKSSIGLRKISHRSTTRKSIRKGRILFKVVYVLHKSKELLSLGLRTPRKNLGICTSIPYLLVMRAAGNGRKLHFSLASWRCFLLPDEKVKESNSLIALW